jgi:hypothetical protein
VSDLATWLLAQYDADEQRAGDLHDRRTCDMYSYDPKCCDCDYPDELRDDFAVKRAIVEMHRGAHECPDAGDNCVWIDGDLRPYCDTLRLFGHALRHREGYDPAWGPSDS